MLILGPLAYTARVFSFSQSVSWGDILEVPPEPSWEEDHEDDGNTTEDNRGDGGGGADGSTGSFDDVVDDDVDDDVCFEREDHEGAINKLKHHDRRPLPFSRRGRGRGLGADDNHWEDGGNIDFTNPRQLVGINCFQRSFPFLFPS